MKVLHLNTWDKGGAALAVQRLHEAQLAAGIDSRLLYYYNFFPLAPQTSSLKDEQTTVLGKWCFEAQRLYNLLRYRRRLYKLPPAPAFYSFADTGIDLTCHPLFVQADVIHLHWTAYFLDVPTFFRQCKKPIVWTLHDYQPLTGGMHYPQQFPTAAYQKLILQQNQLKAAAYQAAKLTVVAPTKALLAYSQKEGLLRAHPHELVPQLLPSGQFLPKDKAESRRLLGLPQNLPLLLAIADDLSRPLKGMKLLLEAHRQLQEQGFQHRLVTIGQAEQLPNSFNTLNLGTITDRTLLEAAYNAVDVLVLPAQAEAFGLTTIEAWSCGLPTLGFSVGIHGEAGGEGFNAVFAKSIDVPSLAAALALLLKGQAHFADPQAISDYAQAKFGTQAIIPRYQQIYQKARQIG